MKHLKRYTAFPYPVEDTGITRLFRMEPRQFCYNRLEVSLRLSGEEECAKDNFNGKDFQTPYPHVIWKTPGVNHSYQVPDHRDGLFFIYSAAVAERLANDGFLPEHPIQRITMTDGLNHLIHRLGVLIGLSEEYGSADRIDLVCFAILEELLLQREMPCNALDDRILKIASILQTTAEGSPDFIEIARKNGFSERSFYRHWKKFFPISPTRYIFEQKMKRASWLLTHSSMLIGNIATMLSFCDENSFSTAFSRYYGVSPRSFRKQNVTKDAE